MKKDGLLTDILKAVIDSNKSKVKTSKPDSFLNQKKQLWFGMMNAVDDPATGESAISGSVASETASDESGRKR